jgi:hypothetical protein
MQSLTPVWHAFKHTRIIPIALATLVLGALAVAFFIAGWKMLANIQSVSKAIFGSVDVLLAAWVFYGWWRAVKFLRTAEVNNTWFAVIAGIPALLTLYAEYGPGGEYVKTAMVATQSYALKATNPTLASTLDQISGVAKATHN